MATETTTPAAAAEATVTTTDAGAELAADETTTTTPQAAEGEPGEGSTEGAEGAGEGEPGEKEGEGAEPPPPADPPRLAAAKRALDLAKKKEAETEARAKELDTREEHLRSEVDRLKGVFQKGFADLQLGQALRDTAGNVGKVLAVLREAGITLNAQQLASAVVQGDEEDQPLTMKQWRELQAKEAADREAKAADERKKQEQTVAQRRAAEESAFVDAVKASSGPAASLIKILGKAGAQTVLDDGWAEVAKRKATGAAYTGHDIVAAVNARAAERLAELRGQPTAAPTTQTTAATTKPPVVSNKTAATPGGSKPKTTEERWEEALRDLS
jgi:hypothetical protein